MLSLGQIIIPEIGCPFNRSFDFITHTIDLFVTFSSSHGK